MTDSGLIHSLPLFRGLAKEHIDLIASRFRHETFPSQTMIFTQGAPADKLYVLISGTVEIRFKPHDGEQLTVTVVQNEGVFGWSSALGRSTYTSCAVSTSDCEALSIEGRTLRELCDRHPQTGIIILERLAEVIAERLRNTHAQIVELLKESMRP